MKRALLSHPGLKIASVLLAICIWLIIVNVNDPILTKTIRDVPVTVSNQSYIESLGKSYRIAPGYSTVSVTVQSNRSVVESLTSSNINVVADLTQIIDQESTPVMLPLRVTVSGVSQDNIVATPRNIRIELEDMMSSEFVITPSTGKTRPATGYQVGELQASPETIIVKGPVSMIEKIDRVTAVVDVTGLAEYARLIPTFHVIDKNGEEFDETDMTYLSFSRTEASVSVYARLYRVVSNIKLVGVAHGDPAPGYEVRAVTATPDTLTIAASSERLAELAANGNTIVVEGEEALDATGKDSDFEAKIDIRQYLPEGIALAEDVSSMVVFDVQILPYNSVSLTYKTKNIKTAGLSEGFISAFDVSQIDMRISGPEEALESLSADSIEATVNLEKATVGTREFPVEVRLPEDCELVEVPKVSVTVTRVRSDESRTLAQGTG